jgi:hypothetical protein
MMPPESDRAHAQRMAGKRLLGGLLMAGGGMIALLCGLCTLVISASMVTGPISNHQPVYLTTLLVPLIIGGVPTAVGVVIFLIGLSIFREGRASRGQPWREFE